MHLDTASLFYARRLECRSLLFFCRRKRKHCCEISDVHRARTSRASSASLFHLLFSAASSSSSASSPRSAAAAARLRLATTFTDQLHRLPAGHAGASVLQAPLSGLGRSGRASLSTVHLRVTSSGDRAESLFSTTPRPTCAPQLPGWPTVAKSRSEPKTVNM